VDPLSTIISSQSIQDVIRRTESKQRVSCCARLRVQMINDTSMLFTSGSAKQILAFAAGE